MTPRRILIGVGLSPARKGDAMTPLRQRMIEDMQLRRFSPRTQEAYVHAVRQLAAHFHKPPGRITEEELRPLHAVVRRSFGNELARADAA